MIRVWFCLGSEYFKNRFTFGLSSVNVGFGSVQFLHRWNWKDVSVVVIC